MKNPQAFPCHPDTPPEYDGMTLRDYFAASVLPQCFEVSATTDIAAKEAYRMADAMMKEREQ